MGADDHLTIHCPYCSQKLAVSVRFAGPTATCPACHQGFPFAVTPAEIAKARAAKLGFRFVDVEQAEIPAAVLEMVPPSVVRDEKILPIACDDDILTVATADPHPQDRVDRLRFLLNRSVTMAITTEAALAAAIERHYPAAAGAGGGIDFVAMDEQSPAPADLGPLHPDGSAVGQRLQRILSDAFRMGASHVLILPVAERVKVAYRVRDVICLRDNLPSELHAPILVRLMTMANLQGVMKVSLGGKSRKLRMMFRPTRFGLSALLEIPQDVSPAAACRALAAKRGYKFLHLDELNIEAAVRDLIPEAVAREYQVLPVSVAEGVLTLAFHDPRTPEHLEKFRFVSNHQVVLAMAPEGSILAAIDRHYGHPDAEISELVLWEFAQGAPESDLKLCSAAAVGEYFRERPNHLGRAVWDQLCSIYQPPALELFDKLRGTAPVCRQDTSGELEVVFRLSHVMSHLPNDARRYLDDKIWALREAIIARLENFVERDRTARGLALSYGQYAACCQIAEGKRALLNPVAARDAWVNFLYAFALHSFPSVESNGALLNVVSQRLTELSGKIAAFVNDPAMVVDVATVADRLARIESQSTREESLTADGPRIGHLLDLLIAEAAALRASRLVLLPGNYRVEVAFRIQNAAYSRDSIPLRQLAPLLDRLAMLSDPSGRFAATIGRQKRSLSVTFLASHCGVAALIDIPGDAAALQQCRDQATRHGYDLADLAEVSVPAPILALIPRAVARRKALLPLAVQGGVLTVAVSQPPEPRQMNQLRLLFNNALRIALAPRDEILAAVHRLYAAAEEQPAISAAAVALLLEKSAPADSKAAVAMAGS